MELEQKQARWCSGPGLVVAAFAPVLEHELLLCAGAPHPSAHSVFISVCSLVKDPSHFQLNKHFPSHVKSSLVLIGVSPHLPPSLLPPFLQLAGQKSVAIT